jgi:serine/threonine protein kinase
MAITANILILCPMTNLPMICWSSGTIPSRKKGSLAREVFEVNDLKVWVRELCEALEHAHQHARFRYELKPANLRVDPAGHLKLAEFGITQFVADWAGRPRSSGEPDGALDVEGPPGAFRDYSKAAADVYTLGVTLYELLTGTPPFPAVESGSREDVLPSMVDRRAEQGVKGTAIPKSWEKTVAACLAKEPAQRPQSALEVLRRLESEEPEPKGDFRWQYVFTNQGESGLQPGEG